METELPTQFQVLFVGIAKRMVEEMVFHCKLLLYCEGERACRWKCFMFAFYVVYIIFVVFKEDRLSTILVDVLYYRNIRK